MSKEPRFRRGVCTCVEQDDEWPWADMPGGGERTALMAAAGNGHVELVRMLLQHGAEARKRAASGETALHWAAGEGHQAVVELLLEHDPQLLDFPGDSERTPLMAAASRGHAELVRMLLQRGADPRKRDSKGTHALDWAAQQGHLGVVEELLAHDPQLLDEPGFQDRTALIAAVGHAHVELARVLLGHGADPARRTLHGETALHWAAEEGHEAAVQLLLEHDSSLLDLPGFGERTALMVAAGNGHVGIVRMLLQRGADPARRTDDGETALHWAARAGDEAAAELLLAHSAGLLDQPGFRKRTPLMAAAGHGRVEMVRRLLERGAGATLATENGETALHIAVEAGHQGVVELLLAHAPQLLHMPGYKQRTALTVAAGNGHLELVRLLLRCGADPATPMEHGERALQWAAQQGDQRVVEELLAHAPQILDLPGGGGRTALMAAAGNGHVELARMLLERGADPRKRMEHGERALHWAAEEGHLEMVQLLLAHDAQLLDLPGGGERTALMAAAANGHVEVVTLLLERGADPAKRMENGESALHCAAHQGHQPVVELLLARHPTLLDSPGGGERTALMAAAGRGHLAIVESLLAGGSDAGKRESDGTRALDWAAQQGQLAVCAALLDHDPQLLDLAGFKDRTALMAAAGNGHMELLRLFLQRGADPNRRMRNGTRALDWAAQEGWLEVVEQLLQHDPGLLDLPGYKERTALMVAAGMGHLEVVRVLLGRGADPRKVMPHGETLLHWVAEEGHQTVAELLLAHDPGLLDLTGYKDRTPLMVAAGNGHVALVRLLLGKGADPRRRMAHGESALHWAVEAGQEEVVQLLLQHDAQLVDLPGGNERTALIVAAGKGRGELVDLLLQHGADPRRREADGTRALDWAAQQGYQAVVEQLLDRDPKLLDLAGFKERTALIAAAGNGHAGVVRLLLERGADPRRRMENGESALHWAAEEGHQEVVELLLARDPQLLDLPGAGERTALIGAAASGHAGVVRVLLQHGASPRRRESDGTRALDWAAQQGHQAVVELLLEHDPQLLHLPGFKGRTPLIAAVGKGHVGLVRMFLDRGADPRTRMPEGEGALDWAAQQGNASLVELLLTHDPGLLDLPWFKGRTALIAAAGNGQVELVRSLIERGADPWKPMENGDGALHWAAEAGYLAVVQLLLAQDAGLLEMPGRAQRTALIAAAGGGHDEVVRVLLDRGADPRKREADGTRALDWAAQQGHEAVVDLLLAHDPELLDLPGFRDRTALIAAAGNGHVELVRLLLKRGADPRKRMADGEGALHWAAAQGHEQIVQLLLGSWIRPRPRSTGR